MQVKEITKSIDEARMSPSTFDIAVEQGQEKGMLVGFEFEICMPESSINSKLTKTELSSVLHRYLMVTDIEELTPKEFDTYFKLIQEDQNTKIKDAQTAALIAKQKALKKIKSLFYEIPEEVRKKYIKQVLNKDSFSNTVDGQLEFAFKLGKRIWYSPDDDKFVGNQARKMFAYSIIHYRDVFKVWFPRNYKTVMRNMDQFFDFDPEKIIKNMDVYYNDEEYDNYGYYYSETAKTLAPILVQTYNTPVHVFDNYHQKSKNLTDWYIEPDGSITPQDKNDGGAEVVSPPMGPLQAIQALQSFYEIAKKLNLYTNSSTGLHINISIPEKIDILKLALFLGDQYVLQQFGREDSEYAISAEKEIVSKGSEFSSKKKIYNLSKLHQLAKNFTKAHSASISNNGKYISFRHAGGNYLADLPKITNTIGRFIRAMLIAADPNAYTNEYKSKLAQITSSKSNISDIATQIRTQGAPVLIIYILALEQKGLKGALDEMTWPSLRGGGWKIINIESKSEAAKQAMLNKTKDPFDKKNTQRISISKFHKVTVLPITEAGIKEINELNTEKIISISNYNYIRQLIEKTNLSPTDPRNIDVLKTILRQRYEKKLKIKQNEQIELDESKRKRKRKQKTARYYYGPAYYFGATDSGAGGDDGGGLEEDWKKSLTNLGIAGAIGLGAAGGLEFKDKIKQAFDKSSSQTSQVVQQPQTIQVMPITNNPLELKLMNAAKQAGLHGLELAQFLAQCAHETLDFRRMIERGSPKYFNKYEPNFAPRKAKILGNIRSGDGERFKGRGYIQLTGRYNYRMAGRALNLPLEQNPELAAQPDVAVKIALWYWSQRVRPDVEDFADTTSVTRKINPGLSGLEDRHENFVSYIGQRGD